MAVGLNKKGSDKRVRIVERTDSTRALNHSYRLKITSKKHRWNAFRLESLTLGVAISLCLIDGFSQQPAAGGTSVQSRRSRQAMVVASHPLASAAGLEVLKQGGNAVDAAVATAFAISVVAPFDAGIGGGGFLLLYQADTNEVKALDFRERAPLAAMRDMYLDADGNPHLRASKDGHLAVAVPGTVAGLAEVHQQYGNLSWQQVLAPAIRLARVGFPIGRDFVRALENRWSVLLANRAAQEVFTRNGQPYEVGDRLKQLDLAQTLREIARDPRSFYRGEIAQAIARDMAASGGLVALQDLERYRPTWRKPLCGEFEETQICAMPPPSSGGVHLLQLLNLAEGNDFASLGRHHPHVLHWMVESMRIAYADRAEYLGDPDVVSVPVEALISRIYAKKQRRAIWRDRARPSSQVKPFDRETLDRLQRVNESSNTSHLSVVDVDRNAVSLTFTVNLDWGAAVVVPGTGILLNNEMDDFSIAPGVPNAFGLVGAEANAIAPGKIPLSSMTPTIATRDGRLLLVVGSPGGSRIITTVFQVLLNLLVYRMDTDAAVSASRLHHQWLPDTVFVERQGFAPSTLSALRDRGHQIREQGTWSDANAIVVVPDDWLEGAADPRGEGAAMGF